MNFIKDALMAIGGLLLLLLSAVSLVIFVIFIGNLLG